MILNPGTECSLRDKGKNNRQNEFRLRRSVLQYRQQFGRYISIFAADTASEDVIYQVTKTLCENRDALVGTYNSLSPWDVATCMDSEKLGGNPLHPGAERYYREMGYIQ